MISVRRLGEDTGRDVVFHLGQQLQQIQEHMDQVRRSS
jgi:hypothetical protein